MDPVFNSWLLPLFEWNVLAGLVVISLVISLIVTVVYKYATNQGEMKALKGRQKEYQEKMKSLRDNPSEMMKVQKVAMSASFEYMKHSFKPTLITMIPILLIFSWMMAHLAYEPIFPNEAYGITATFKEGLSGNASISVPEGSSVIGETIKPVARTVSWQVKSPEGRHELGVVFEDSEGQQKEVIVGRRLIVADQVALYQHSDVEKITIDYAKLKPLATLSVWGWYPGWLALYILFSLVFSLVLRKVMNIY